MFNRIVIKHFTRHKQQIILEKCKQYLVEFHHRNDCTSLSLNEFLVMKCLFPDL